MSVCVCVLARAESSELSGKVEERILIMKEKGRDRQEFCLDKII